MTELESIRELPHALASEKYVLSSFMRRPELLDETEITADWFYLPGHRIVFEEMQGDTAPFDLGILVQRLHAKGLLDHAGGPSAVADLYSYAVGTTYEKHVTELRDRYARRTAAFAIRSALEAVYDTGTPETYLEALGGPITAVFDIAAGTSPPKDMKALAREFLDRFQKLCDGESLPMGIPFGLTEIDQRLRGMHPQHYGIISGRSGSGKSTLAVQVMGNLLNVAEGGLYLILERTEGSAFAKAVVQLARLNHKAVTDPKEFAKDQGNANPDQLTISKIKRAIVELATSNLHIRKPDNRRLATVMAEIRRYHRIHGVKVVVIDQIGLVRGERVKGGTAEEELRLTSNQLQELAHELNLTLIVLCQETAEGETKNARAIEEDADWWLSIFTERDKKKDTFGQHQHVLIAKDSHNGSAGTRLPLIFDHDTLRFIQGQPEAPAEPTRTRARA